MSQLGNNPKRHQLRVHNLSCSRGERLLFKGVSFNVEAGQCLHLKGSNGSGKTSMLRMLCTIRALDQGSIKWNARSISNNLDYLKELAYIGHKDGLKNELSAAENLEFYQALAGHGDLREVDSTLAKMGILQCADLTAVQLSFGQRRRLAFARLLLEPASLWVLDEPFTGIDQAGRLLIESLCVAHLEKAGLIILTNHQSLAESTLAPHLKELSLDAPQQVGTNE